jgi:hypothetical protein
MDNEELEPVDHDSPEGVAAHLFLERVREALGDLLEGLHDSGAIPEGKYFRTTFGYSCGFQGHIDFVVESEGDCTSPTLTVEELDRDRLN